MSSTYKTKQGDMWDWIAYSQLGDELYMDDLIAENIKYREVVVFPAGVTLTIPTISTPVGSSLPPWKQST
ncbi:MAG: phage tail protein [Firmicutes bacterium]|nr:phage tail protein [Bacillota bacterium]